MSIKVKTIGSPRYGYAVTFKVGCQQFTIDTGAAGTDTKERADWFASNLRHAFRKARK